MNNLNNREWFENSVPSSEVYACLKETMLIIRGGNSLNGTLDVPGGKWYLGQILPATLICKRPVILHNVPATLDTLVWIELLKDLNADVCFDYTSRTLSVSLIDKLNPYPAKHLIQRLRASIGLLAPLFALTNEFEFWMPGGDKIGNRPYVKYLELLGIFSGYFDIEGERIRVRNKYNKLKSPKNIVFSVPQTTSAVIAMIVAAASESEIRISNIYPESEVFFCAEFLRKSGFNIAYHQSYDAKNTWITIGKKRTIQVNDSVEFDLCGDPTWLVSYATAAAITKGSINFRTDTNIIQRLGASFDTLKRLGVEFNCNKEGVISSMGIVESVRLPKKIEAELFPAISTDHLPFISLLCMLSVGSKFQLSDHMFESRHHYLLQAKKMLAQVSIISGSSLYTIQGARQLAPCDNLLAKDIRGCMVLLLAALATNGDSTLKGIQHLYRGYENPVCELIKLGADIEIKT